MDESRFRVTRIAAPLRHSVVESIRDAIAAGKFKAGDRLPERELCEMTDVSRTLVREALRQLESEGLIKVIPHRGPIVAGVTPEQAQGIYQVRRELEGLASQLFAQSASDAARTALRDAFRHLKIAFQDDDPVVRLKAKNRFYECLIDGCGNEALGQTLRMLNSRVMVLRATSLKAAGRARQSLKELGQLMDALLARDGKTARKLSVEHVDQAAAAALNVLALEHAPPEKEAKKPRTAAARARAHPS